MVKKVNKQQKIAEFKVTKFIFWFPITMLFFSIFVFIFSSINKSQGIFLILAILLFSLSEFVIFIRKKIIITNKKIYIYDKITKSKIGLDLVLNLSYFKIEQNIFGKIFNYGTIYFVDKNNLIYKVEKIGNPFILKTILINETNNYLKNIGINEELKDSDELINITNENVKNEIKDIKNSVNKEDNVNINKEV